MGDFSWGQILIGLLSAGAMGTFIAFAKLVSDRLDKRAERMRAKKKEEIDGAVEVKRLEMEGKHSASDELWRINEWQAARIKELEAELEEQETKYSFSRPTVTKVYANIRAIRKEISHLNLMVMSEEDTNVFMRRFGEVLTLLDETESILP